MEDEFVRIDVDSNGQEDVAEIDSRHARKTISVHIGTYKPIVDGKPPKRQRNLTSTIWEHY